MKRERAQRRYADAAAVAAVEAADSPVAARATEMEAAIERVLAGLADPDRELFRPGRSRPRRARFSPPRRNVGPDHDAPPAGDRDKGLRNAAFGVRNDRDTRAAAWIAVTTVRPDAPAMVGLAQVAFARGFDADALAFAQHAVSLEPDLDSARIAHRAITQNVQQAA